jgi:hypothetical protein
VSVTPSGTLFRFSQIEVPWAFGPPDGRYLMRREGAEGGSPPSHVLLFATLGAPERRHLATKRRRQAPAEPEPPPAPVTTGRATVIPVDQPFPDAARAAAWLAGAGEDDLAVDLVVLNRALHAFRLVTGDPYSHPVGRASALVARIGYGAGEEVADGRWSDARELLLPSGRERRAKVLQPQARLAAVLGQRERALACEELALRAHLDLDQHRPREAALQVLVALDAAVAELSVDPLADRLADRLAELRDQRDAVAAAAQAALAGNPKAEQLDAVAFTLQRIEAALRFRAVQNA